MEIYPAREKPMKGVSSKSIFDLMENDKKVLVTKETLYEELDQRHLDVVLTVGAGDIDKEVPAIAEHMKRRYGAGVESEGLKPKEEK